MGSPDQWGWKTREHFLPLLHIPALGQPFVSEITQPFHARYVPPMYVEMHCGGCLLALSKDPKRGSRSIAIVDAWRWLLCRSLSKVTRPHWPNGVRCHPETPCNLPLSRTNTGSEESYQACLLLLRGKAVPVMPAADIRDDLMKFISSDAARRFQQQ